MNAELDVLYNPDLTSPDCTHERIGVIKIEYVADEGVEQPDDHPFTVEMLDSLPFMVAAKGESQETGMSVGTFYLVLDRDRYVRRRVGAEEAPRG
jgi:hypothetical protein